MLPMSSSTLKHSRTKVPSHNSPTHEDSGINVNALSEIFEDDYAGQGSANGGASLGGTNHLINNIEANLLRRM